MRRAGDANAVGSEFQSGLTGRLPLQSKSTYSRTRAACIALKMQQISLMVQIDTFEKNGNAKEKNASADDRREKI